MLETRVWGLLAGRAAEAKEEGQSGVLKDVTASGVGGTDQRRLKRNVRKEGEKPAESKTDGEVQSPDFESSQTVGEVIEHDFGVKQA